MKNIRCKLLKNFLLFALFATLGVHQGSLNAYSIIRPKTDKMATEWMKVFIFRNKHAWDKAKIAFDGFRAVSATITLGLSEALIAGTSEREIASASLVAGEKEDWNNRDIATYFGKPAGMILTLYLVIQGPGGTLEFEIYSNSLVYVALDTNGNPKAVILGTAKDREGLNMPVEMINISILDFGKKYLKAPEKQGLLEDLRFFKDQKKEYEQKRESLPESVLKSIMEIIISKHKIYTQQYEMHYGSIPKDLEL